jgi:hypothetical protein
VRNGRQRVKVIKLDFDSESLRGDRLTGDRRATP